MSLFHTVNPTDGKVIQSYETLSEGTLLTTLSRMDDTQSTWAKTPLGERCDHVIKIREKLLDQLEEFAQLITKEMGKPIKQARAEIEKCAYLCQHYTKNAAQYLQPQSISDMPESSYVCHEPLGIILGIMPWNYPFWQVFRYAIPTILAGNVTVLKHAPNVLGCGIAIDKLFLESGLPEHIFKHIILDVDQVPTVIQHPAVAGVTLTGSDRAGSAVAACAGKALKKVVLELGGSDPYLILEDADLSLASQQCVQSRLNNSGQVCIAAKRILVVDSIYDEFLKRLESECQSYILGDPKNESTQLGPLARADLRENLHQQVQQSIREGAICQQGGFLPEGDGFFYPVTLLTDVQPGHTASKEELFGPVIVVSRVADEESAIAAANDTPYGLGAAVFTRDTKRGERIAAKELKAGVVSINRLVSSDPRLPFGGIKQSGFGRELGAHGMLEFTNIKTIIMPDKTQHE